MSSEMSSYIPAEDNAALVWMKQFYAGQIVGEHTPRRR
jgi:hypothetical protein